jgi:tRNA-binding protein
MIVPQKRDKMIQMIMATVDSVVRNPTAKIPAYIFNFDVGSLAESEGKSCYKSSAQVVTNYQPNDLLGKQLLVVANFPRKQIGKMKSDCLTVAVQDHSLALADLIRDTNVVVEASVRVPNASCVVTDGCAHIMSENARDLTWDRFIEMEIVSGTILEFEEVPEKSVDGKIFYGCKVDIGSDMIVDCSLILGDRQFDLALHSQKQVLVMTKDSILPERQILTVSGMALLHPERPVKNGMRLA